MSYYSPAGTQQLMNLAEAIAQVAAEMVKEANKRSELRRSRPPRGRTLRPGAGTPHWNALVALVRPLLRKRGARALLAREMGVHRARVTDFFITQRAMPDAERTLEVLLWLAQRAPKATTRAKP